MLKRAVSRALIWVASFGLIASARAGLPEAAPASLGFDADRLHRIDAALDRAIERKQVPGVAVIVGRRGAIGYVRAVGQRAVGGKAEAMTRDTVFDLASLTKPIATATSIMILIDEGRLRTTDRAARYLAELDNRGKGAITIDQLLRHRAGFVADNPIGDYSRGADEAWKRLFAIDLASGPGEQFRYSDVGFEILGKLVERVSGKRLDAFATERIFGPLGMKDAHFRPRGPGAAGLASVSVERIAPTEAESPGGSMLRGVVHDPRSRALGGVAGHAGLFASADDLAIYAQTLLNGGRGPGGKRILSPLVVRAMIDAAGTPAGQRRGLGWDVATSFSSPRGELFGASSFGHTGFTGTSLWIDPETETFVIILTSRLHPDGKGVSPSALRHEVATLAAAAIEDASIKPQFADAARLNDGSATQPVGEVGHRFSRAEASKTSEPVLCGIDVLIERKFAMLEGRTVGLVTNHTGRARGGESTIDVLFRARGVRLVKLFSPEHGIRGLLDTSVADSKDDATGLPIVSLYGKARKPTGKDLEGIDTLVFDIQDIGARFYTYISTLGLLLESAKENGKRVIVLDRPNPIGGRVVAGPLRDDEFTSFIAYHRMPVRHGMTVGELALLFNTERKIGADLEVVRCRGWSRDALFDQTGLLWTNPSPNMRSLTEALLYPGVGLLEATNIATGRGTDTPFERVGAPWIDPLIFASALNGAGLAGVRFLPIFFTPSERQHSGERCGGVLITIMEWRTFEPLSVGITLARVLRDRYRKEWKPEGMLKLLNHRATYEQILAGESVAKIASGWEAGLSEFGKIRMRYLLYP